MTTRRIAIVLEGGLIQGIYTDDDSLRDVDVMVIDYDTDGAEPVSLVMIPQTGDYEDQEAYAHFENIDEAGDDLSEVERRITEKDRRAELGCTHGPDECCLMCAPGTDAIVPE